MAARTAEQIYQSLRVDLPEWLVGDEGGLDEATLRFICEIFAEAEAVEDTLFQRTFIGSADGLWLDEHGLERGIQRLEGESDDDYRVRLRAIEDVVSPAAVLAGIEKVLKVPGAEIFEFQTAASFYGASYFDDDWLWPLDPPYFVVRIPEQVVSRAGRGYLSTTGDPVDVRSYFGATGGGIVDAEDASMFFEGDGLVGDPVYRAIYETVKRIRAGGVGFIIEVVS